MRPIRFHYALLALLALFAAFLIAQDDAPITISDGSLTMQSAVEWPSYTNAGGNTRAHPNTGRAVTKVAVTMPGQNRTINFNGQRCTVTVRYLSTDVTFSTGNNGRGLSVTTDFSSFQQGATRNHLVHRNTNGKISRVTVMQGNQTVFDNTANGGTQIVISYQ